MKRMSDNPLPLTTEELSKLVADLRKTNDVVKQICNIILANDKHPDPQYSIDCIKCQLLRLLPTVPLPEEYE